MIKAFPRQPLNIRESPYFSKYPRKAWIPWCTAPFRNGVVRDRRVADIIQIRPKGVQVEASSVRVMR